MDRKDVSSSTIKSIGHDPSTNMLEIEFHSGKVYSYSDVSPEKHAELVNAKSIGQHFGKHIRSQHNGAIAK